MNVDIDSLLKALDSDQEINLDSDYFSHDYVELPKEINNVTSSEFEHIKKYRTLDEHGKEMVDIVLQKECERSTATREKEAESSIHTAPVRLIRNRI